MTIVRMGSGNYGFQDETKKGKTMAELGDQIEERSRALYEDRVRAEIFRGTRGDLLGNPPSITLMVALPGVDATTVFNQVVRRRESELKTYDPKKQIINDPTQQPLVLRMADLRRLHPDYDPQDPGKNDAEVSPWCQFILEDALAGKLPVILELEPSLLKNPAAMQAWVAQARQPGQSSYIELVMVVERELERGARICRDYGDQWQAAAENGEEDQMPPLSVWQNPADTEPSELAHTSALLQAMLQGGATNLLVQSSWEQFLLTFSDDPARRGLAGLGVRAQLLAEGLSNLDLPISGLAEHPEKLSTVIKDLLRRELLSEELFQLQESLLPWQEMASSTSAMPESFFAAVNSLLEQIDEREAEIDREPESDTELGDSDDDYDDDSDPELSPADAPQLSGLVWSDPTGASVKPLGFLDPRVGGDQPPQKRFREASPSGVLVVIDAHAGADLVSNYLANQPGESEGVVVPEQLPSQGSDAENGAAASLNKWLDEIRDGRDAKRFVVMPMALEEQGLAASGAVKQAMKLFPQGSLGLCVVVSSPGERDQTPFAEYQRSLRRFEVAREACARSLRNVAEVLPVGEARNQLLDATRGLIKAVEQPEMVQTHLTSAQEGLQAIPTSEPELEASGAAENSTEQLMAEAQKMVSAAQEAIPRFDRTPRPGSFPMLKEIVALAQQNGIAVTAIATPMGDWRANFMSVRGGEEDASIRSRTEPAPDLMQALQEAYERELSPRELAVHYDFYNDCASKFQGSGFPAGLREGVFQQQAAVARQIGLNPTARQYLDKEIGQDKAIEASREMAAAMVKRIDPGLQLRDLPEDFDLKKLNTVQVMGVTTHHAVLQTGGNKLAAVLLEKLEERGIKINEHQRLEVPGVERDAGKNKGPVRN